MVDRQLYCATCRKLIELDKKAGRREECPHCAAEVHACLNCQHYDPRLTRGCREPNAVAEETIRDVRRANYCQWFDHRLGPPIDDGIASSDQAKAAFDTLFGGSKKSADPEKERAEQAFSKLFKR